MSRSRTPVLFVAAAAFALIATGCRTDQKTHTASHHETVPTAAPTPSASDSDSASPTPVASAVASVPAAAVPTTAVPLPPVHVPAPAAKPAPPHTTKPAAPAAPYYANCDAVRAAGKAPLYRGQPGYRAGLDRDGDGVACE